MKIIFFKYLFDIFLQNHALIFSVNYYVITTWINQILNDIKKTDLINFNITLSITTDYIK